MSDDLSAITRWECERCGAEPEDRRVWKHPDPSVRGALCYGRVTAVEYVPASQLRGAVAALEEIEKADPVDLALDPTWSVRVAREALRVTRTGTSTPGTQGPA